MFMRIIKTIILCAVIGYIMHAHSCEQLETAGMQDIFKQTSPPVSFQRPTDPQQIVGGASNALLDTFNNALKHMGDYRPGQRAEPDGNKTQFYDNAETMEDYYIDMNKRAQKGKTYEEALRDIKRDQ